MWWHNLLTRYYNFRHIRAMNKVVIKRHGEKKLTIHTMGDDMTDDLRLALWCIKGEENDDE